MTAPVWLVTGAGSGVGRALAQALAASGAEVLLASRQPSRLRQVEALCGPGAVGIEVDLADPVSTQNLADSVRQKLAGRPLAGLVHAAGTALWSIPSTPSGWSLVPRVNAVAPWQLTQALESELLKGFARVLFVAGAPVTLRGVTVHPDRWRGDQPGKGLGLALEAAVAKVLMARVLDQRWHGRASAFAFHPGLVRSHLADSLPWPVRIVGGLVQPFLARSSTTGEFLALDPQAPRLSGHLVAGRKAVDPGKSCDAGVAEAWLSSLS